LSGEDIEIFSRWNIRWFTYEQKEIEEILKQEIHFEPAISLECPELDPLEDFLKDMKTVKENFGDINILLEDFKGEEWWQGYYDFRAFWLWKEGKDPKWYDRCVSRFSPGKPA